MSRCATRDPVRWFVLNTNFIRIKQVLHHESFAHLVTTAKHHHATDRSNLDPCRIDIDRIDHFPRTVPLVCSSCQLTIPFDYFAVKLLPPNKPPSCDPNRTVRDVKRCKRTWDT